MRERITLGLMVMIMIFLFGFLFAVLGKGEYNPSPEGGSIPALQAPAAYALASPSTATS